MTVKLNTNPVSEIADLAYDVQPLAKDKKEVEKPKDEYILMPANPQIPKGKMETGARLCMAKTCPELRCQPNFEQCNGKDICNPVYTPCDKEPPAPKEPCDKEKPAPEPCSKSRCDLLA